MKSTLLAKTLVPAMMLSAYGDYSSYGTRSERRDNSNAKHQRRTEGAADERKRKAKRKMAKTSKRKNRR